MKNTNESGRSMVEMLGVLAIIGVLSIGGIAGYTMAMNKVRANEIVGAVVQAAIDCRTRGRVSTDITTPVQQVASNIACSDQATGVVSYQTTASEAIAKMVCKGLGPSYTAEATAIADEDGSNATDCAGNLLNTTLYFRPQS